MKYSIRYIQISYNSMPIIKTDSLPKVLRHRGVEGATQDAEALALVQHALNKHLEEIFPLEKRGLELLGALKFDKQDFADGVLPLPYADDGAACTWADFCRMGEIQGYGSGSYPNCVLKFQDLSLPRCLRHESLDAAREDARALQALLDRAIVAWHLSEYSDLLSRGIALAHSLAEDKADIAERLIPWPLALDDVAAPMWCSFLQDPELLITTAGLKDATRALMKSIGLVPPAMLFVDGALHFCAVRGQDREKALAGRYIVHADTVPSVWARNCLTGESATWTAREGSSLARKTQEAMHD